MYVHAILILPAMIKLPCLVSENYGSNQGCLERTTFSIPGRRGTGRERACGNSMNTRYGSLRCAAIGADRDVKSEEVRYLGLWIGQWPGVTIAQFRNAIRTNSRVNSNLTA